MKRHGRLRRLKVHRYADASIVGGYYNSLGLYGGSLVIGDMLSGEYSYKRRRAPDEYLLHAYAPQRATAMRFDVPSLPYQAYSYTSGIQNARINSILQFEGTEMLAEAAVRLAFVSSQGSSAFSSSYHRDFFLARDGARVRACVVVGYLAGHEPLWPIGRLLSTQDTYQWRIEQGDITPIEDGEAGILSDAHTAYLLIRAGYAAGRLTGESLYVAIRDLVASPTLGKSDIAPHSTPTPPLSTMLIELGRIQDGSPSPIRRAAFFQHSAISPFNYYYGGGIRVCAAGEMLSAIKTGDALATTPKNNFYTENAEAKKRHGQVALSAATLCSCAVSLPKEEMRVSGWCAAVGSRHSSFLASLFDAPNRGDDAAPYLVPVIEDFGVISDAPYAIGAVAFPNYTAASGGGGDDEWRLPVSGRGGWEQSWMPTTVRSSCRVEVGRRAWHEDRLTKEGAALATQGVPVFRYDEAVSSLVNKKTGEQILQDGKPIEQKSLVRVPVGLADVRLGRPRFLSRTVDGCGISDYDDEIPTEPHGEGFVFCGKRITGVKLKFEPYLAGDRQYAYSTKVNSYTNVGNNYGGSVSSAAVASTRKAGEVCNEETDQCYDLYEAFYGAGGNVELVKKNFGRGWVSEADQQAIIETLGFLWRRPIDYFADPLEIKGAIPACPLTGEFTLGSFSIGGIESSRTCVNYSGPSDFSVNKTWTHTTTHAKLTDEFVRWNEQGAPVIQAIGGDWQSTSTFTLNCHDSNIEVYASFLFGAQAAGEPTDSARKADVFGDFGDVTPYDPTAPDGRATRLAYQYAVEGDTIQEKNKNRPRPIIGLSLFARTSWIVSRLRSTTNSESDPDLDAKKPDGTPFSEFEDVPKLMTRAVRDGAGSPPAEPDWGPANAAGGGMVPRWAIYTNKLEDIAFSAEQTERLLNGEEVLATDWPLRTSGEDEEPIVLAADDEDISIYGHTVKATLIFAD